MITALRWQRTRGGWISQSNRNARYGVSVGGSALEGSATMVLLRQLLGDVLRRLRLRQGRTLREVSASARVSLGYLSEVERGQKEASSELLAAICGALGTPLSQVFREVSDSFALAELQTESGLGMPREPGLRVPAEAGRGLPPTPDFVSITPSIRAPKRAWTSRTTIRASAPPPGTCARSRIWCPSDRAATNIVAVRLNGHGHRRLPRGKQPKREDSLLTAAPQTQARGFSVR